MKNLTHFVITIVLFAATASARDQQLSIAQQKALDENSVLFVPQGYDVKKNPSFAFEEPLKPIGPVPKSWKLFPRYSSDQKTTKVIFNVPFGASLYGTGEVTGPLLRNGKKITLWNTDSSTYVVAHGSRLYQSHPWVWACALMALPLE